MVSQVIPQEVKIVERIPRICEVNFFSLQPLIVADKANQEDNRIVRSR